jgi:hypothetical protein
MCAIEDAVYRGERLDFWDSVFGFDMSCMKKMALLEPLVDKVRPVTGGEWALALPHAAVIEGR